MLRERTIGCKGGWSIWLDDLGLLIDAYPEDKQMFPIFRTGGSSASKAPTKVRSWSSHRTVGELYSWVFAFHRLSDLWTKLFWVIELHLKGREKISNYKLSKICLKVGISEAYLPICLSGFGLDENSKFSWKLYIFSGRYVKGAGVIVSVQAWAVRNCASVCSSRAWVDKIICAKSP